MRYETAIFDMDGTILNTLEDLFEATNAALRHFHMPERTIDEVRAFVGNGAAKLIERAVPDGTGAFLLSEVLAFFRPYYAAHADIATAPYPGIPGVLSALQTRGIKLAVVSNKPDEAVKLLSEKYFPGCFAVSVGARDGIRIKPSPDSVNEVLQRLHAPRETAVYIGDSDVDLLTAKNASVPCLSVSWGFRDEDFLRANGAACVLHTADELLSFF